MPNIVNAIEAYEDQATAGGDLEQQRAKAMDYYLGVQPVGNGIMNRSQVVSRDVADSISWILPSLLRIFTAGDDVVSFAPRGQEDIEAAKQETDFVNFIITQKNNWFDTAYQWFSDALLQKNGYVKAYWDETIDLTKEEYRGKTQDELAFVMNDPDAELLEVEAYDDPYTPPSIDPMTGMLIPPAQLYNFTVQKKQLYACAKFCPIAPERTVVYNLHAYVDLEKCEFIEHWEYKSLSQLRQEGFDVPDDIGDETGAINFEVEEQSRNRFGEDINKDDPGDPSMRKVKVRECWIRFDEDEDGIAELRHAVVVGKMVLLNEETDMIPIACITPRIMPHRHIGISDADSSMDVQDIKTALQRGLLDNLYFAVNGRHGVDKDRVNLDDMLTSRPAGIVRTDGPPQQSIMPLVHEANFQPVLASIQYFDTVREDRTGSSKASQQLSPDTLAKLPSGIAIAQVMSASQALTELKARVFAETGVKSLFRIVHALHLKNAKKPEVVRLRNKWVAVDPREWKKRSDLVISVGLGTGSREQQLVALERTLATELQLLPLGLSNAKTIHHVATKMTQAMGFKDTEAFWVDPEQARPMQPPPPPPPDPVKIGELKVKAFEADTNRFEAQTGRMKAAAEARLDRAQLTVDQANANADRNQDRMLDMAKTMASTTPKVSFNADETLTGQFAGMAQSQMENNQQVLQMMQVFAQQIAQALAEFSRPKRRVPVRDKAGNITHVDEVPMERTIN